MPELVASPQANLLAARALFETGKTVREVAAELSVSPATAWRLKHSDAVSSDDVHQCSKTLADRHTFAASLAIDTVIEQGLNGEFSKLHPLDLAKLSSTVLQAAGNYNLATGAKDLFSSLVSDYGIEASHSVSRITVTKSVSLDTSASSTPQPVVIAPTEKHGK